MALTSGHADHVLTAGGTVGVDHQMQTKRRFRNGGLRVTLENIGLNIVSTLGVISLLLVIAGAMLKVTPLVVTSGSMNPTIPTGALAIAREVDASDVAVGDVVSVLDRSGRRVTHRVVATEIDGDGVVQLTLQGDANADPDANPYGVSRVDLVSMSIPGLGRLIADMDSPPVYFALGMIVSGVLSFTFRVGGRRAVERNAG